MVLRPKVSRHREGRAAPATSPPVEYTDAAVPAVVDLVPAQGGVAVRLDPHSCHGVVKDFIVLDKTQA